MIKKFILFAFVFVCAMALNSCGDDDEPAANFHVPDVCHNWGASREQARQQMEKYGWTYTGDENEHAMNFEITKKNIECTVFLGDEGGLSNVTVFYIGMNVFFDDLKSELTKRFNVINWKTQPQFIIGETADKTVVVTMYKYVNKTKGDCMAYQLNNPKFFE